MPIHGISDVRRFPRLGKLRLGVKTTGQKGSPYPRAVDFFVCNADESTTEAAAKAFHDVYGDKPKAIDIMFPTENPDQFFPQFYRRYGSGAGLLCKGDGATATELDRETGELREIECDPTECEWATKKHCRPIGTLQFLMPRVPGLGVWQIDTSSYHSIVNLNSGIDFVRSLTGGRVSMIPLKLIVRHKDVQVNGNKKTVFVLDIAHDQVRLEDVLKASRTSLSGILLPAPDLEERPDCLYPSETPALPKPSSETEPGEPGPDLGQVPAPAPLETEASGDADEAEGEGKVTKADLARLGEECKAAEISRDEYRDYMLSTYGNTKIRSRRQYDEVLEHVQLAASQRAELERLGDEIPF